jgi:serine/threonine protein kinase
MEHLDAKSTAQELVKIGLITEPQMVEALDELDGRANALALFNLLERKGLITPWQTSKFAKGDREGFILGGYRILYKISSGSFGRVFRAVEQTTGRVVAIKILRRRWSEDQQKIDLFTREGRVGMTLRHPNIVEVITTNVDKKTGQYYIVMEFVEGGNLREILAIRKLSILECVKLLEDCAAGLAYAYSIGITHRDIKLTNVLVSSTGTAKLVDFGLAKIVSKLAGQDEEKVDRTVDYAGLERGTGVKAGDIRSDIYFLGCVFYEMISGRPPMEMTRDKNARMQKHRFDSVRPLTRADVEAPPSVFRLVETMMELNPTRRYQTPNQLLEAIRAVRRELEAKTNGRATPAGPRPVYVIESDERLKEAIRDALKKMGYRVMLASDPSIALDRYRQHPFDGLVVDARTVGEDGLLVLDRIAGEADRHGQAFGAILILSSEQADWTHRIKARGTVSVLVDKPEQHVTLKQLLKKVQDLVPLASEAAT